MESSDQSLLEIDELLKEMDQEERRRRIEECL